MCSRNCCNIFWSVLLVVGLIATLAAPWYGIGVEYHLTTNNEDVKCAVGSLYGWQTEYCGTSDGCSNSAFAAIFAENCPSHSNWRDRCSNTDSLKCAEEAHVFDVALGLCVISMFCGLVTLVGFFTRCCTSGSRKSKLHMVFTFLGFFFLLVAMAYFAHRFPKGIDHDETSDVAQTALVLRATAQSCPSDGDTPCNRFFGKRDLPGLPNISVTAAWGGAGWIAAVLTCVLYLVNVCLACTQSELPKEEHTPMYQQGSYQQSGYQHVGGATSYQSA